MLPDRKEAESFLRESEEIHPGPWADHCRPAAECAEKIARNCSGLDPEKAYIIGLLHDIGRRIETGTHFKHIVDGYECMMEYGYDEVARVCMTHSFQIKNIESYIGKIDVPEEKSEMVRTFLNHIELDDYDLLMQSHSRKDRFPWKKDFVISKKDMAVIPKTNDRDAMN